VPFILKIDSEGFKVWGIAYFPAYLPLKNIDQIIENNGYITVAGNSRDNEKIYVATLTNDGLILNTNSTSPKKEVIKIFPNPSGGTMNIKFLSDFSGTISVISASGDLVFNTKQRLYARGYIHTINLDLSGVFFLVLKDKSKQMVILEKISIFK